MKQHTLFIILLFFSTVVEAQNETAQPWQQVYYELYGGEDEEDGTELLEEQCDILQQLSESPLNLNQCSRHDLEQLPFLSAQQVMDIEEYLYRYGPMRSLGELRMVRSLDYPQLRLLPMFVYAGEKEQMKPSLPPLDTIAKKARKELIGSIRIPFYERRGNREMIYLGPKYRHWLRYSLTYGKSVKLGIIGTQDAGEPFLSKHNKWGYDAYSYYLQVSGIGPFDTFIIGKYKLSAAMGLVLGNGFSLGKTATLQSLGRQTQRLRPHITL